jgi:hypothetical protein
MVLRYRKARSKDVISTIAIRVNALRNIKATHALFLNNENSVFPVPVKLPFS